MVRINDRIDDAYRRKYAGSPYLSPMIGARARAATVRVRPLKSSEKAAEPYHSIARFDELDKVVEELKRKERVDGRKKRE